MTNNHAKNRAVRQQSSRRSNGQASSFLVGSPAVRRVESLEEDVFLRMLTLERRRAERSCKPFVLMLLDAGAFVQSGSADKVLSTVTSLVLKSVRETDLVGWYKKGLTLGIIFTELSLEGQNPITEILVSRVVEAFRTELDREITAKLVVTVHLFPESQDRKETDSTPDLRLYPDLSEDGSKRFPMIAKRVIDVLGSAALLLVLSPILALIALAIKLTSKGPVIFRQQRLGQFGKGFKCLKFRTMYSNNDPKIHQEYIQSFIANKVSGGESGTDKPPVYKITNDPRVTTVGRILRKTSLDELPQFWNVLIGEMSLVGPRPPVPYEFEMYDIWHRRRVLEVRPGVTGLWQVSGRSSTCFDDMVRLDLRYSKSWSLWLDLRILAATPGAVFSGDGAY